MMAGQVFPVKDLARAAVIADEILKNNNITNVINKNSDPANYLVYKITVDSIKYL